MSTLAEIEAAIEYLPAPQISLPRKGALRYQLHNCMLGRQGTRSEARSRSRRSPRNGLACALLS